MKRVYMLMTAGALALAAIGTLHAGNYEEEAWHVRGDLTCDGIVDAHDTLILMQYIVGLPEIGSECPLPGTIIQISDSRFPPSP